MDIYFAESVRIVDNISFQFAFMLFQVRRDRTSHASVHDNHVQIVGHLGNDGVVNHMTVLVQKKSVNRSTMTKRILFTPDAAFKILRKTLLQEFPPIFSKHVDHSHMAGIEKACRINHCKMFSLGAMRVPQGHIVSTESCHIGSLIHMPLVQRSRFNF